MITTDLDAELSELLADLSIRGIDLWAHEGRLRYRAPAGALDERLREEVGRCRSQLVALLERMGRCAPSDAQPGGARDTSFPMTDIQQAYWVGESGIFELGAVRAHIYLEFERPGLDVERLTVAWRQLVARHAMLRAVVDEGGRLRTLESVPAYTPTVEDWRGSQPSIVGAQRDRLREAMTHEGPATDSWPLFDVRVQLADLAAPTVHVSISLLVCDALSTAVLLRELEAFYADPACEIAPLRVDFADYARSIEHRRHGAAYDRARDYWLERLRDLPPAPELPLRRSPTDLDRACFGRHVTRLPGELWSQVKEMAALHGVTPSSTLLTAYAETLDGWCKSPRFTINVLHSARGDLHPDINRVVGNFSSTILVEVPPHDRDGGFGVRARAVQQRLWADLEHREFSGVRVLGELNASRDQLSRAAMPVTFASALYVTERKDGDVTEWQRTLAVSRMQTPQVWLDHQVFEDDGDLVVNWDVVDGLLEVGVVEGMLAAYEGLVRGLAGVDGWGVGVGDVLGDGRAGRVAFNATDGVVADGLLQSGFLEWAAVRPDAVAVIGERVLSYGELERRSAAVAACLVRGGVGAGSLVAVVMDKGWEQVVGVLGVLRAGAGYVPVDPQWPAGRREVIFEQCDVSVALTQSWLSKSLSWPEGVGSLAVDELAPLVGDGDAIDVAGDGGRLAYVIFTSGSTGRPKGVAIDHRGALNTVTDVNRRYGLCREDRVLGISALSFDLSVWDIFGTLTAGGALVLPDAGAVRDPAHWCELLVEHDVTVWNSAPALMSLVVEYAEALPGALGQRLRLVMLSGDWIAVTLPDRVRALTDGVRVVSLGGATEASIWSIAYDIEDVDECWRSIPYGRPLANQHVYVLDHRLRERPDWAIGEIYIGGAGVSIGYHADAQRTAERFIAHPDSGERLYRTGDLGRQLPDGVIEFLGREDFQVKIQGYRIELEEIEAVLLEHHAVSQAVVSAHGPRDGTRTLAAHIVTHQPPDDDLTQDLRAHAATHLPTYMLPNTITILDALPLTPNGKIDRNALTTPTTPTTPTPAGTKSPPDGPVEAAVARAWADVLGVAEVATDVGFVSAGGQSLSAIRLALRLERELGQRVSLALLFENATVADVARALTEPAAGSPP